MNLPPHRSMQTSNDAEILGLLAAVDDNHILAALGAGAKTLSAAVQLLPRADSDKLKKHLTKTRGQIAEHLAAATQLHASL